MRLWIDGGVAFFFSAEKSSTMPGDRFSVNLAAAPQGISFVGADFTVDDTNVGFNLVGTTYHWLAFSTSP